MKMVGTATYLPKADSKLAQLQGYDAQRSSEQAQDHAIRYENHKKDFVAGFSVSNNKPHTTDTNTKDKGRIAIIKDIFGGDSSVHNCYGLGQPQCMSDGYRQEDDLQMHPEATLYQPAPTSQTIAPVAAPKPEPTTQTEPTTATE